MWNDAPIAHVALSELQIGIADPGLIHDDAGLTGGPLGHGGIANHAGPLIEYQVTRASLASLIIGFTTTTMVV